MKRILIAAVAAAMLAGCAAHVTRTEGTLIDEARVRELQPGVTTRGEVIREFGDPAEVKRDDGTEMLVFTHSEVKVPTYLGGLIEGEALGKAKTTTLEIKIKNGVVSSYSIKTEEDR